MKSKVRTLFNVSLLALLLTFTPVVVIAQGTEENTSNETPQTTAVEDTESTGDLKSRLEKRKAEMKTKVDAAKQARLKSRCKASQGNLSSISGRIKGLETSRSQVYQNLLNRLNKLSEKLAAQELDVAELNTQITELSGLITTFNTELAEYKQTVADLAEMDCVAEPIAFQASLEAARTARAETAEAAKAVKAYLKETIKPTLSQLRAQITKEAEVPEGEAESEDNQTEGGETE